MLYPNTNPQLASTRDVIRSFDVDLLQVDLVSLPTQLKCSLGLDRDYGNGETLGKIIGAMTENRKDSSNLGEVRRIEHLLVDTFHDVSKIFSDPKEFQGKSVLDIACGASDPVLTNYGIRFEPWRARFLKNLGFDVVGIDSRPSPGESYHHIVADLEKDGLRAVGKRNFDLVVWCAYLNPDPEKVTFGGEEAKVHVSNLRQQLLSLTNPNSLIYTGEDFIKVHEFNT